MSSRTDGQPRRIGRALIGLCALALALQGIAALAVDLPGGIEAGGGSQPSHVHAADDHPESSQGLLPWPRLLEAGIRIRLQPSGCLAPRLSPVFRLIQPPRFA